MGVAPDDATMARAASTITGLMGVDVNLACGSPTLRIPVDGDKLLFITLGAWKPSFVVHVSETVLAAVYHTAGIERFSSWENLEKML
jgi:hypothetical protein